jgi:hypothetical protein
MGPVPQRHRDSVGNKGNEAVCLLNGELRRKPLVDDEAHAILGGHVRLQKRHAPSIDNHIMVSERTRKVDPDARQVRALMRVHGPSIRQTAMSALQGQRVCGV